MSSPKVVTLSTTEVVTFRPKITHKIDFAFYDALSRYMAETKQETVTTFTMRKACEGALFEAIEGIVRNGETAPCTQPWLDALPPADYQLLEAAYLEMRDALNAKVEDGEKKGGASGGGA